jgi:hypothetical protein
MLESNYLAQAHVLCNPPTTGSGLIHQTKNATNNGKAEKLYECDTNRIISPKRDCVPLLLAPDSALGYFQGCTALSEYRQGQFSEAVVWAEKSLKTDQPFAKPRGMAY